MMAAWLHEVGGLRVQAPRIERGRRPLWAYVWPAGLVLAELVATAWAERVRARRVLDLGCGLGVVGLCAAKAGARVTLVDREPEALAEARAIAAANGLSVDTSVLDWSRVPEGLVGAFDVILGADIMYDPSQLTPMAGAIAAMLADGGAAYLADPDRADRDALFEAARAARLTCTCDHTVTEPPSVPTSDESHKQPVHVYALRAQ